MRSLSDQESEQWYKNAVIYELYVRAFFDSNGDGHGDLRGVTQKLDYLKDLGVTCIWLLPIFSSPLKDDGYDIADYYSIHPDYGTLDDFKELLEQAHQRGIRLITDLVVNHTSDQHPWFQQARCDPQSPFRNYFVWSDTANEFAGARIIFVDTETSNWTWDEAAGQYFWHRFYSSQPDLNYDHPAVREEIKNVMKFWLDLGVDGFRVDAVPYLFEREGTNCENLPETHTYLKELRSFLDQNYSGRVLLCEANQWPKDVREYFGDGDEFQMGFHFPLMPRIYMALRRADREPICWALEQTPPIPDSCGWCIFLRNHDELTLEMVTEEERQWMWQEYAPDPRMRLNLGIRRRLAPLMENDQRKIELINSILFTLPGTPVLYYGDEIGMGDNVHLADRNGVRTPMQWENGNNAGFSLAETLYAPLVSSDGFDPETVNVQAQTSKPDSLLNDIKKMIRMKKKHQALAGNSLHWEDFDDPSILAYWRGDEKQLLVLQNLSPAKKDINLLLPDEKKVVVDLLQKETIALSGGRLVMELAPYQYRWLEMIDNS